jgi:hypothetical protein
MKTIATLGLMLHLLVCPGVLSSAGANKVSWDVIAAGGVVGSSSTNYRVSASVGQTGVDLLTGVTYHVYSGFWNPWLIGLVGADDPGGLALPATYQLSQNHPNPFDGETTIPYAVPRPSLVTVEVYNLRGQRVRLLTDGVQQPGYHFIRWDGRNAYGGEVGSGIYLCRMTARASAGTEYVHSTEMLLVR